MGVKLVAAFLVALLLMGQSIVTFADPAPGNLTTNWSFEQGFYQYQGGEVGNGWTPFVIGPNTPSFRNTAAFNPSFVEKIDGDTSQMIWADGPSFMAGIYQKINATPGAAYIAFYCTSSRGATVRTVGIDPLGGTDPQASSVVWGTTYNSDGHWATRELGTAPTVRTVAQKDQITLFIKVTSSGGLTQTWIDAVQMIPDSAAPLAATATSKITQTPVPPTQTPTSQATSTPTLTPTSQATSTPTLAPTKTVTPTLTVTPTPAPTGTPTVTPTPVPSQTATALPTNSPTLTPTPSRTPEAAFTPTPTPPAIGGFSPLLESPVSLLPYFGFTGILLTAGWLYWAKRKFF